MSRETVAVLDFGGQYTQLIARRVRENRVYCEIHPSSISAATLRSMAPVGIILSGGPQSVYDQAAPQLDAEILDLGIPVLGICYGMQLCARELGGTVSASPQREYGRTEIEVSTDAVLFDSLDSRQIVWMSHGDSVTDLPAGVRVTARTESAPVVAFEHPERRILAIQFHPEVTHTPGGGAMLRNFLFGSCRAEGTWRMASYLDEAVASVRERVGGRRVICALSGGVDSSVAATLVQKAVGEQLICVFVDTGLLRKGERVQVEHSLRDGLGMPVVVADARQRFLEGLEGVVDPEEKRKTIGRLFIDVFREEAARHQGIEVLVQGTLYPDLIESTSFVGPSVTIKSHHNVGGLPEELGFDLVEPLRLLFKDEVRQLGRELAIPEELIQRHPFPGPGLAIRILGPITQERVEIVQEADAIFLEELREADYYDRVSQALAVLLPVRSVGVMGDGRTYDEVIALRAVETKDFMTADWSQLPHELLARVANRIVNEVAGINRVVYDITSKPPGTIEWE